MNIINITESVSKQIADLTKAGSDIVGLFDLLPAELSSIEPDRIFPCLSTRSLVITLPFDRSLMKTIRSAMTANGWKITYEISEREASSDEIVRPSESYRLPGISGDVTIFWNPFSDSATCHRQRIGTTTKEVPVYEFSCEATNVPA